MTVSLTWHDVLANEKKQPYFINIINTIISERQSGKIIYPLQKDIFNAFRYTELNKVKVVILGQDPYHGVGQAHGLAFSVLPDITIPPSLMNIYRELENSITGFNIPNHGFLTSWTHQGVLLLNTILTVRAGCANSHSKLGWEIFTNKVISIINKYREGVIFLLWGSHAHKKNVFIDHRRHHVLQASHPSPLSMHRGFFGCNHFVITNKILERRHEKPINWVPVLPSKKLN